MKKLLLGFCCAILLSCVGPVPSLRAQGPQGFGADLKHKRVKEHKEKHHKEKHHKEKHTPLHTVPKALGWWHGGGPGPAGAGAK